MKTPEEIKKGLECCILETDDTSLVDHCRACPYQPTGLCFRTLLKDALEQLEAQVPKWISVEVRLPKEHERVLVAIQLDNRLSIHTTGFAGGEWLVTLGACEHVTHWMPLPEPPKEG